MSLWRQLTRGAPRRSRNRRPRTGHRRRSAALPRAGRRRARSRAGCRRRRRGAPRGWSSAARPPCASRCAPTAGRTSSRRCSPTCATPCAGCAPRPGFTRRQRAHAGARHRRQHGDLQRGQPDPVRAAALSASRSADDDLGRGSDGAPPRRHVRHVPRTRRAEPLVRGDGGHAVRGSRRSPASQSRNGSTASASAPAIFACSACGRHSAAISTRRTTRLRQRSARGHHQRRAVAAALRRRSGDRRARRSCSTSRRHRRRRHARRVRERPESHC